MTTESVVPVNMKRPCDAIYLFNLPIQVYWEESVCLSDVRFVQNSGRIRGSVMHGEEKLA